MLSNPLIILTVNVTVAQWSCAQLDTWLGCHLSMKAKAFFNRILLCCSNAFILKEVQGLNVVN